MKCSEDHCMLRLLIFAVDKSSLLPLNSRIDNCTDGFIFSRPYDADGGPTRLQENMDHLTV